MKKIAVFPGSFDPFTIGHESVVRRGLDIFDEIIVGIGYNTSKKGFISIENRTLLVKDIFADTPRVKVEVYNDLTVDFCQRMEARFILRGLRTATDFEYERAIAQMNLFLRSEIETVFLLTKTEHTPISSTIVREVLRFKGDVSKFVSPKINIHDYLD